MNASLLKSEMVANNETAKSLAAKIGISRTTLSAKMTNKRPFTLEEVNKICEVLQISNAKRIGEIFLPQTFQK